MFYVYILANANNTTIYTGMTNDLPRRIYEHKNHLSTTSFTTKYRVTKLVYFESADTALGAITREKQIKSWSRAKKNQLIESLNPSWCDLYDTLF